MRSAIQYCLTIAMCATTLSHAYAMNTQQAHLEKPTIQSCSVAPVDYGKLNIQIINNTGLDFSASCPDCDWAHRFGDNLQTTSKAFTIYGPPPHKTTTITFEPIDIEKKADKQFIQLTVGKDDNDCYFTVNNLSTRPDSEGKPQIFGDPEVTTITASGGNNGQDGYPAFLCVADPSFKSIKDRTITFKIIPYQ